MNINKKNRDIYSFLYYDRKFLLHKLGGKL